jgi:hypothetical protein
MNAHLHFYTLTRPPIANISQHLFTRFETGSIKEVGASIPYNVQHMDILVKPFSAHSE